MPLFHTNALTAVTAHIAETHLSIFVRAFHQSSPLCQHYHHPFPMFRMLWTVPDVHISPSFSVPHNTAVSAITFQLILASPLLNNIPLFAHPKLLMLSSTSTSCSKLSHPKIGASLLSSSSNIIIIKFTIIIVNVNIIIIIIFINILFTFTPEGCRSQ